MEKEINEGKRICTGVIGSDLDESLPLRKVESFRLEISNSQMIRRLVEELERSQLEVEELRHEVREEKKKNKEMQNLLEEMVSLVENIKLNPRAQKQNNKKKVSIRRDSPVRPP